jgi:hypothetical protein
LIYHPEVNGNIEYDANGTSSIDFAPSALHLLGLKETKAPFLGHSIFSNRDSYPLAGLTGGHNQILFKDRNGVWQKLTDFNKEKLHPLEAHHRDRYDFMMYAESLERSNHLWPSKEP